MGFPQPIVLQAIGVNSHDVLEMAHRLGLEAAATESATPRHAKTAGAGPRILMLLSDPGEPEIEKAVRPPISAGLEIIDIATAGEDADALLGQEFIPLLDQYQMQLSLSAATAYDSNIARIFCQALAERTAQPKCDWPMLQIAVHEALANAVIHGSLEVGSFSRSSPEEFETYNNEICTRLDDKSFTQRRVTLSARWDKDEIEIRVQDQGPGFTLDGQAGAANEFASERGLGIIHEAADSVQIQDGGRRVIFTFAC
jgi:anti-sigma regulatory factor (Ser/Thr protein kinase)